MCNKKGNKMVVDRIKITMVEINQLPLPGPFTIPSTGD